MTASRPRNDLFRDQLRKLTRLLPAVAAGEVPAIHKARVATRRLRELVPLLPLKSSVASRLLRDLRRATRALGRVREQDVTGQLLAGLRDEVPDARVLARVHLLARRERRAVFGKATKKGRLSDDLQGLVRRLEKAAGRVAARAERERGVDARRWRWAAEARLARRARALAGAIEAAGPFYVPERVHQVRIALKKLRYGIELDGATRGAARPELRSLKRIQELLGQLHDRQLLIDRLRAAQARLTVSEQRASRELDRLVLNLENECRRLHARYLRHRPRLLALCAGLVPSAPADSGRPMPAAVARVR